MRKAVALSCIVGLFFMSSKLNNAYAAVRLDMPCTPGVSCVDQNGVLVCACGTSGCPAGMRCVSPQNDIFWYCDDAPNPACETAETCNSAKSGFCGDDGGCSSPTRRCEAEMNHGYHCVDNPSYCSETCNASKSLQCGTDGGCNSLLRRCEQTEHGTYECVENISACTGYSGSCDASSVGQCGQLGGCTYDSQMCVSTVSGTHNVYWCRIPTPEDIQTYGRNCGVNTLECGVPGTENQCNYSGGCPTGFRCTGSPASCQADSGCTTPVCSPLGGCGAAGGCPLDSQICDYSSSTGNYCRAANTGECPDPVDTDHPTNVYKGPNLRIEELIQVIYSILVPVSIGIGLFFIILAGYTLKTSEGQPDKKRQGMEQLSAAIIGTLFVGFSLTILRIIINAVLGGNL